MIRLPKTLTKKLSTRISLMIVAAIALLLSAALCVMFHFSRKGVRNEAVQKAEQTLETTVQQVDNILLSAEQSAGNVYWEVLIHLDQPDRMFVYSRKLVETNPYIVGCAIAFEPYYYQERGQYFMAYVHRTHGGAFEASKSPIIQSETFGNVPYTEQVWYTKPIETGVPCWINPLKEGQAEGEAIITFSLPIFRPNGTKVGVLAVDVSVSQLSQVVLAAKPSPHSYATMLGSDGSFIVHPDSNALFHHTLFTLYSDNPDVQRVGEAMLAGESGYQQIRSEGTNKYVFYKPYVRSAVSGRSLEPLGWSIGIVYPEADIFGSYHRLVYIVLLLAVAGLLLLQVLCRIIAHRQLLPLRILTKSAQRIAEGHFYEPIPSSRHHDEVGRLQIHFKEMQKALALHMDELERLNSTLNKQGEVLTAAYKRAKEADRMKTAFLHNMTNQMMPPVSVIYEDVNTLCHRGADLEQQEIDRMVDEIQKQSETVTKLLDELLSMSQEEQKTNEID